MKHCSDLVLAVLALVMAACAAPVDPNHGAPWPATDRAAAPSSSIPAPATQPCRPAPLEARAATVLDVGIGDATSADQALPAQVATLGVGGVILLGRNVADAARVGALIDGLHQRAPRTLLATVDEEGDVSHGCAPSSVLHRRRAPPGSARWPRSSASPLSEAPRWETSASTWSWRPSSTPMASCRRRHRQPVLRGDYCRSGTAGGRLRRGARPLRGLRRGQALPRTR